MESSDGASRCVYAGTQPSGGDYVHEWIANQTHDELKEFASGLRAAVSKAPESEYSTNAYRSLAYRRYRYARWLHASNRELTRRGTEAVTGHTHRMA